MAEQDGAQRSGRLVVGRAGMGAVHVESGLGDAVPVPEMDLVVPKLRAVELGTNGECAAAVPLRFEIVAYFVEARGRGGVEAPDEMDGLRTPKVALPMFRRAVVDIADLRRARHRPRAELRWEARQRLRAHAQGAQ